ncbi:UNVERIFIED_CONTAM: hypothetical protein Sindi_3032100, partial [Sesamum indicum]
MIWGRSNDAMLRTIQGGNNHAVFAKDITAGYEECPAIGQTNRDYRNDVKLSGSGGKVADFVSNSNHVAIVDEMGVDSVNVDLFTNDVVKCVADRKKETCVDVIKGDSVNNDDINIDLVNNVVNVDMDNYKGKKTCVEVVKGDLVNNDEINIDLVNTAVHVDMDNEEDSVDAIKDGNSGGFGVRRTYETNSTYSGLLIGNIPLQTSSDPVVDDKIADAFNNSSGKTLSFGTIQNDEIV